jgi:uncharacterized protein YjbJ (UPF0337 family)
MAINKDQVKGRLKQAAGKLKAAAGKAVGNPTLRVKGAVESTLGKAQAAYGDVRASATAGGRKAKKKVSQASKRAGMTASKTVRKARAGLPRVR